jgi:hypothetical protein
MIEVRKIGDGAGLSECGNEGIRASLALKLSHIIQQAPLDTVCSSQPC